MEKRVLFTELDDRGSHLRKEITPTAVVTDKRRFPAAQFWDANKTMDTIVADATTASDTLEKAENNLNSEIQTARAAEAILRAESVAKASYDSQNKLIKFYNTNNVLLDTSIDATDFIKDGMVNSVAIQDVLIDDEYVTCLVITFNTDSGLDPINIPLEDIFDPNNYYTKTQVDTLLSPIPTFWVGTQAQYDLIDPIDPSTIYIIK